MKNKLTINIITPFPEMFKVIVNESILLKSQQKEIVKYNIFNLFDYLSTPKDRIDDYPYGGGDGMILKAEPIFNVMDKIKESNCRNQKVIFPTPDGVLFNQKVALDLSKESSITFISGHYKGIDQRIRDELVTDEYSIGDYVLTNGELPTMVMIDSIIRLKIGVLNNYDSALGDSFINDLLDGPHYTRPRVFRGLEVPEILLSGNHEKIKKWFIKKREKKTEAIRLDLWKKYKNKN